MIDYAHFPNLSAPFFVRGGTFNSTKDSGVFVFNAYGGDALNFNAFRVVVPVL